MMGSGSHTTQGSYSEGDSSQTNGMRHHVGPQQRLCLLAVYPNLPDESHYNAGLALTESQLLSYAGPNQQTLE